MNRQPPRSTRTDTSCPPRRSSDRGALEIEDALAAQDILALGGEQLADPGVELAGIDRRGGGQRHAFHRRVILVVMAAMLRSEEHTSELQSLMRISYAVFCLINKQHNTMHTNTTITHTLSQL